MPTVMTGSPNIRYASSELSPSPQMVSTTVQPYQDKNAPTATRPSTETTRAVDLRFASEPQSSRSRPCPDLS